MNYFPHSPYENRCPFLHDPRAKLDGEENNRTIIVPVKTKMHNGDAVVDRLYHHKNVSVLQTNPIISPHTWEKCRPSGSDDDSKAFEDTYNLICNVQKAADSVLPSSGRRVTGCGPVLSYKDRVVMNSSSIHDTVLDELRKLCIVLLFHDTDEIELAGEEETRFDYTYEPKDCEFMFMIMMIVHILSSLSRFYIVCNDLPSSFFSYQTGIHGQPCKVLRTEYFQLLDIVNTEQPFVSRSDIVVKVPREMYLAGKSGSRPNTFVCAHEVVFDSKGTPTSNDSM